jgi:hypothetical protein
MGIYGSGEYRTPEGCRINKKSIFYGLEGSPKGTFSGRYSR